MSFKNEEIAQILGNAVLEALDKEGLQITWKPKENENKYL